MGQAQGQALVGFEKLRMQWFNQEGFLCLCCISGVSAYDSGEMSNLLLGQGDTFMQRLIATLSVGLFAFALAGIFPQALSGQ
ncbi:MAG: hypothetical protein DPW14_15620 [Planctomycetes bacterium]|nr:hypothetical protein [Planctomycetota bacterium]